MKEKVKDLENRQIVKTSDSHWNAPALLVPKMEENTD